MFYLSVSISIIERIQRDYTVQYVTCIMLLILIEVLNFSGLSWFVSDISPLIISIVLEMHCKCQRDLYIGPSFFLIRSQVQNKIIWKCHNIDKQNVYPPALCWCNTWTLPPSCYMIWWTVVVTKITQLHNICDNCLTILK